MTSFRFDNGGLIDRQTSLGFSFDGKAMTGHAGDTLASALLANGQLLMGRSFKYHRPRSVVTCGAAEPNALMEIGEGGRLEPNTRATMQELYEGLIAKSQNRWPTLERDFGAINSLASSLFVAGFYYKTFMWPKKFWESDLRADHPQGGWPWTVEPRGRPGPLRESLCTLRRAGGGLRPGRFDGCADGGAFRCPGHRGR
jgi:NADPH-dependent 2,4-dienoyl-CoA reductase/sulfur reductase-like enzyme